MADQGPYTGTVLRVNLTDGSIEREPLDTRLARDYIGGRGYTSRMQYDLIPVNVDPLGPENVLLFAPGALTGTSAPSAARFVVAGRSPLTGIFGDANSGGYFGPMLKRAGYSLLIITGQSPRPVYLRIDDDQVELRDAQHLWGKEVHEATDIINQTEGKGFRVAAIGPAGENLVRIASVMADKEHAAGRTGLGAVMGSKKLKAIAVRTRRSFPYCDEAAFKALAGELRTIEDNDRRALQFRKVGTLGTLIEHHSALGGLNTRNYQTGVFEGKEKIDHEALVEGGYLVRTIGCYQCTLKCDRLTRVTEGEYAGTEVGGPEYNTAASLGSSLGIDYLPAILKGNDLANRYGLDTLDLGGVIAFAMELYQRGLLSKEEADGLELEWGNHRAALELMRRIAFREGAFADLLANGVRAAAEEIGRGAERYAVHVKGMTPCALDARAVKVYNFRFAVSPRGADHLRISAPGGYTLDQLPMPEAAAKLAYWQSVVTIPDLMGVCKFAYTYYTETPEKSLYRTLEVIPKLYHAATGFELTGDELMHTATRINDLERAHNNRLGLTAKDDTLPPRFTEDPMPEGPAKGKVYDILEPFKKAWYTVQGWNPETGIPRRERLESLGLGDVADDLEKHGIDIS